MSLAGFERISCIRRVDRILAMFPVTESNLSASSLVRHVLFRYDLTAVRRCRLHDRG
jgi:hypothetical protein